MAGLTSQGFLAKTYDQIRMGFESKQRASISAVLDTSDFSLLGQLNGLMATELAALWELAEDLNDAMDPDKASGESQDALYSLTATLRGKPAKSTVVATVTLKNGANIAVGAAQASVLGNASAKFVNDEPMVNNTGAQAEFPVRFVATQAGPVLANSYTLIVIDTPNTNWVAITNTQDATAGSLVELDSAYRLRRVNELAAQGGGTTPGIRADLLKISTVRAAIVRENTSNNAIGNLPPKSIQVIVRSIAGANDALLIGQTIWRNKSAGVETVGDVAADFTDSEGYARKVYFSRPTEKPVTILTRVIVDPATYLGDDALKAAIAQDLGNPSSANYCDVGTDVFSGRVVSAAMKVQGVKNCEAKVAFPWNAEGDFETRPSHLDIGDTEIATFDSYSVSVTQVAL